MGGILGSYNRMDYYYAAAAGLRGAGAAVAHSGMAAAAVQPRTVKSNPLYVRLARLRGSAAAAVAKNWYSSRSRAAAVHVPRYSCT